jgi:hypothetical protein
MKSKGGNKSAVVATANKIATIFYKMVTQKETFKPLDLTAYQEKQPDELYRRISLNNN